MSLFTSYHNFKKFINIINILFLIINSTFQNNKLKIYQQINYRGVLNYSK